MRWGGSFEDDGGRKQRKKRGKIKKNRSPKNGPALRGEKVLNRHGKEKRGIEEDTADTRMGKR